MKNICNLFLLFNLSISLAQPVIEWQRSLGGSSFDSAFSIQQTNDDGFIVAGYSNSNNGDVTTNYGGDDYWLIKLNKFGAIEWEISMGGGDEDRATSVLQTLDDGYIVAGNSFSDNGDITVNHGQSDYWVVKLSKFGNIEWQKSYGGSDYDEAYSIQLTSEGGYIIAGTSKSNDGDVTGNHGGYDYWVVKLNSTGTLEWQKSLGGTFLDVAYSIKQTLDGGYITAGESWSNDGDVSNNHGGYDYWVVKLSNTGIIEWQKSLGGIGWESAQSIQQTSDEGFIVAGNSNSINGDVSGNHGEMDYWIVKLSNTGTIEWQKSLGGAGRDIAQSIQQTLDGEYIVAGYSYSNDGDVIGNHGSCDYWIVKLSKDGNIVKWQKLLGGTDNDYANSIQQTSDDGFIIIGTSRSMDGDVSGNHGWIDYWIMKLSSAKNNISGYVFNDVNSNCIFDSTEIPFPEYVLQAYPWESYATPDKNGFFQLRVDTGKFEIRIINSNPYKSIQCPPSGSYHISFDSMGSGASTGNNFGIRTDIYCPWLEVNISTSLLHWCSESNFYVKYCNYGSVDEYNAYIIVTFHDSLMVQSSNFPMTNLGENIWRFDIDTVKVNECGAIIIRTKAGCNIPLGTTLCVSAMIYPDTLCIATDPIWDKSSVKVTAACVSDTIGFPIACFTIYNTGESGSGNMQDSSQWRLYANDTLILRTNFQLNGGDSLKLCFNSEGKTLRLEADQRPGHPGKSHPRATLEGCGVNELGNQYFGFYLNAPEDDEDKNVEIFCLEVTGSFDPNDKNVKPRGSTPNHYINEKDELEYQINFQNTGNDTAFTVVIRDTLDVQTLDIATIQNGVSSHINSFRIYDQSILEWKFNNILLPDSNVNETASHGFVKFNVNQKPANSIGTLIENRASIYFDYNAPVITNTTNNMIWNWDTTIIVNIKKQILNKQELLILYPNPSTGNFFMHPNINCKEKMKCTLYNLNGTKIYELPEVDCSRSSIGLVNIYLPDIPAGMYILQLRNTNQVYYSKLVVE